MNEMNDNLNGQNDPVSEQEPVNINVDENTPGGPAS
jgi:hypothetical protein